MLVERSHRVFYLGAPPGLVGELKSQPHDKETSVHIQQGKGAAERNYAITASELTPTN